MHIYLLGDKIVPPAITLQMIEIQYIPNSVDLKEYDALIFTSKNGAIGIDKITKEWLSYPSYAIAPQTAKVVKELGGNVIFVGKKSHGDAFADEIIPQLQNKKALYIRGKEVVSNLLLILKNHNIECDELIVYETVCKKYEEKPILLKNSIIIFSSPSTLKCFFENYSWDESFVAIAIGNTTAKYFPSYITPLISEETSLESCVKKALEKSDLI
jgi:uroporphyrinogen-III synthase